MKDIEKMNTEEWRSHVAYQMELLHCEHESLDRMLELMKLYLEKIDREMAKNPSLVIPLDD